MSDPRLQKFKTRQRVNQIAIGLSMAAMAFGLVWLIWILWETFSRGVGGLQMSVLTQMTPAPNEEGGLANAIYGSFLMVLLSTVVGTPVGVLAGIYLSEYSPRSVLSSVTRFVNDILLSAPSIVIGLFVYTLIVARFKSFSGWAGVVALALIVVPVVIRTTENMLQLVPAGLREAAYALGTPSGRSSPALRCVLHVRGWSPVSCWLWPAFRERPRPCCSPRSATSSGPPACQSPWPVCRSPSSNLR